MLLYREGSCPHVQVKNNSMNNFSSFNKAVAYPGIPISLCPPERVQIKFSKVEDNHQGLGGGGGGLRSIIFV